jgi:hypothetical protein
MNGKGDKQRPTNKRAFDLSFDRIFGALLGRKKAKPPNQQQQVLDYLAKNLTITTAEANTHLGVTRLSSRIFDLKAKGYEFDRQLVVTKNRVGKPIRHAQWRLKS